MLNKINLDIDITLVTKLTQNGLQTKCKSIKLLEANIRENLDDSYYGDKFLDTTPEAQSMKKNNL